jgi:hypothetical protein
MAELRYIFNHIAKTGGNSLLAICQHNIESSEVSQHLTDDDLRIARPTKFEAYRMIVGHFSLPSHARASRGRYSMTLLRDPIRRVLSGYRYWRGVSEINDLTAKAKELSFPDFVRYFERSPLIVLNPYSHHFAGAGREFPTDGVNQDSILSVAKRNLSAFDFVGICEYYERSARLLCMELGWQVPAPLPFENRSYSERDLDNIDQDTLALLRKRNELDYELYAYGVELFRKHEERIAAAIASGRFPEEVRPKNISFHPFPASIRSREAEIQAVSAQWRSGGKSPQLEIGIRFRTVCEIPELVLGIAIFDMDDKNIWGTNTFQQGFDIRYAPRQDCRATFMLDCELPAGKYSVTVALHRANVLGNHDHWWDRSASFDVLPGTAGTGTRRELRVSSFAYV